MAVKVDSSGVVNALNRLPDLITRSARVAVKEWLTSVQIEARRNHRFTSRTGALDRSVQVETDARTIEGQVFLDLGLARYGPYIHDGFKSWQADQFLFKAADKKRASLPVNIQKAIRNSIKTVGL